MVEVRVAELSDANDILTIYAPYILHTAYTFETEVPTEEEFKARMSRGLERFPWLVCRVNKKLAGYVYASPHRERAAYQWSSESSIYLAEEYKGKGLGTLLYKALFQLLTIQGIRNVYAVITLPNEASVRVHEKCGFQHFTTYENVGYKLGWQKVGWWRLQLNEFIPEPPPPIKFSRLERSMIHDLLEETTSMIRSKLMV